MTPNWPAVTAAALKRGLILMPKPQPDAAAERKKQLHRESMRRMRRRNPGYWRKKNLEHVRAWRERQRQRALSKLPASNNLAA